MHLAHVIANSLLNIGLRRKKKATISSNNEDTVAFFLRLNSTFTFLFVAYCERGHEKIDAHKKKYHAPCSRYSKINSKRRIETQEKGNDIFKQ